jgi:serine/threonine-protein kinase
MDNHTLSGRSSVLNLYQTLEVNQKASLEVIKGAYLALSKKHRTDEEVQKKINAAFEILNDKTKKAKYDKGLNKNKKGKVIGNYRILDKIAEGGFGTTYKAEHLSTQKLVCIKHMNEISSLDQAILMEEAKICWDLRHWGIPAMRDILEMPDDSLALVMSYVPGPTLAEILQKYEDGLEPEHVAWITERTLNTLKYLHYNGVVHGDLKPQNIIVQPEDHTAVLCDYGLSQVKPSSKDSARGYTPFFAAPEQESGKVPIPETDFYGLGITMIFALGGDVKSIKVPSNTPTSMVKFIKKLIKRSALSRPNWQEEDLCETIAEMRSEAFGRNASNMKPLKLDW